MITAYHRPKTLDEALTLLTQPNRIPLGGGTLLSKLTTDSVEAVDLQAIGLSTVKQSGNNLEIGATVTLQQLLASEACPEAMKAALKLEAPLNLRNSASVAGTIVSCDGRSTFESSSAGLTTFSRAHHDPQPLVGTSSTTASWQRFPQTRADPYSTNGMWVIK